MQGPSHHTAARAVVAALVLLVATERTAAAQIPLVDNLFSKVKSAALYHVESWYADSDPALAGSRRGLAGYGVEFLMDNIRLGAPAAVACESAAFDTPALACRAPRGATFTMNCPALTASSSPDGCVRADTSTPYACQVAGSGHPVRWSCEPIDDVDRAQISGGIGFEWLTGFDLRSVGAVRELHGAVHAAPTVSVYYFPPRSPNLYLMFGTAALSLANVRVYDDTGLTFKAGGSTFAFNGGVGWAPEILGFNLSVELRYQLREFRSVDWTLPSGVTRLPSGLPRSLRFNALVLNVGIVSADMFAGK